MPSLKMLVHIHIMATPTGHPISRNVESVALKYGSRVHRTPVGEIHVADLMREIGAVTGGEGNGGLVVPDVHYTRDAFAAIAVILGLLARRECTVSSLVDDIPRCKMVKKKLDIRLEEWPRRVMSLPWKAEFGNRDGLYWRGDSWWLHIRKSNTEPIVRILAEATKEDFADELADWAGSSLACAEE